MEHSDMGSDYETTYSQDPLDRLERVLFEGIKQGKISSFINTVSEVEAYVRSMGFSAEEVSSDLMLRALGNIELRGDVYRAQMEEETKRKMSFYEKHKNRPAIKGLVDSSNITDRVLWTVEAFNDIDELYRMGEKGENKEDYNVVFGTSVYSEDPGCNLAFLLHVEETSKTTIKTPAELKEVAKLDNEYNEYPFSEIEHCFYLASEERYYLALLKTINSGGKLADLLAIKPSEFNLPDNWSNGIDEAQRNQQNIIDKAIYDSFHFEDKKYPVKISLGDVADRLEAPYSEILRISNLPRPT